MKQSIFIILWFYQWTLHLPRDYDLRSEPSIAIDTTQCKEINIPLMGKQKGVIYY